MHMNTAVQFIIVVAVVALAVWYLYGRFRKMIDPNQSSCGCGSGSCCSRRPPAAQRDEGDTPETRC